MAPRTRALIATALVVICLGLMLGGSFASSTGYRTDRMQMTTACSGAEPIYLAPNGTYWVWRGGWREVQHSTGESCRWEHLGASERRSSSSLSRDFSEGLVSAASSLPGH